MIIAGKSSQSFARASATRGSALLFAGALLAVYAFAQAPRKGSSSAVRNAINRRVTLDVVVTDKSGKTVPGLQQQDFTVTDNKHSQVIVAFHEEPDPVVTSASQVIILIDAVNASWLTVSSERLQLAKLFHENEGQMPEPVTLDLFTDQGRITPIAPATRDGNALMAALDANVTSLRTLRGSQGFQADNDLVQLSLDTLKQFATAQASQPGRKIVVWISPGWPIFQGPANLSVREQQRLFESIVAFSTLLRKARITLDVVNPLGAAGTVGLESTIYDQFLNGVRSAKEAQPGDLSLQVLAEHSGGLVLTSNDLAGDVDRSLLGAKAYYTLSYDSPPADGPNEYHAIGVRIDKPHVIGASITEYYAQPQQ